MTRKNTVSDYEFWVDRTTTPNGCHLWTGPIRNKGGYGGFTYHGKTYLAHRFGWMITYGQIPPNMKVCHSCDTPLCNNPRHWFLGTQMHNMIDRGLKGRTDRHAGETNGRCKLSDQDIVALRFDYENGIRQVKLAKKYSIHKSHVSRLVNMKHTKR